jgi:hypothetical protein
MTLLDTVRPQTSDTPAAAAEASFSAGSRRFDWLLAVTSLWILAGTFLDGWYHNTFQDSIETFFTPWHGILYSGLMAAGAVLVTTYIRNVNRGYYWRLALPTGYMLSLLGFMIFALGGGVDFAWHTLFGFEADEEALLSPAHLLLATGAVLLTSGPLRAAWRRTGADDRGNWAGLLPALLSLLTILSIATFFTQYANAFTHANMIGGSGPVGETYFWNVAGITGVLLPTAITMGFILLAIRRWTLPIGSMTLLLGANATLMFALGSSYAGQHWPVVPAALAGGVLADALLAMLKPSAARMRELRLFAALTPFSFFLLYMAALIITSGVWWQIHMWLGAPCLAGVVGLGLSYLIALPHGPAAEHVTSS